MSAEVLSKALEELARAKTNVAKIATLQIRSHEQRTALRALAFAWFQSHRPAVGGIAELSELSVADSAYRSILDSTEKNSTKKTYLDAMASAKEALIALRISTNGDVGSNTT